MAWSRCLATYNSKLIEMRASREIATKKWTSEARRTYFVDLMKFRESSEHWFKISELSNGKRSKVFLGLEDATAFQKNLTGCKGFMMEQELKLLAQHKLSFNHENDRVVIDRVDGESGRRYKFIVDATSVIKVQSAIDELMAQVGALKYESVSTE